MSDISYRIVIDERYEAELNRLRIERNAAWRENEKLREENERLIIKLNAEHIVRQNVEAENAKLRELVRDMWEFGFGDNSGADDAWAWHERTDELEGRMAELGVEVDE